MIIASLYSKPVNKSIAFHYGQKNNGYSAFTEYPLSRLPTPSDRCHNRNFWNYFLMSTRVMLPRSFFIEFHSLRYRLLRLSYMQSIDWFR